MSRPLAPATSSRTARDRGPRRASSTDAELEAHGARAREGRERGSTIAASGPRPLGPTWGPMDRLLVTGGARLAGTVPGLGRQERRAEAHGGCVARARDARCSATCPRILDCVVMGEVLERLGVGVAWTDDGVAIDATTITRSRRRTSSCGRCAPRSSCWARCSRGAGRARVAMPGGDEIGSRPIDLHLAGSRADGRDDPARARVRRRRRAARAPRRRDHARLPERRCDREPDDGGGRGARHDRDRQRGARARDRRHRRVPRPRWARGSAAPGRARSRSRGSTRSRRRARTIPDRIEAGHVGGRRGRDPGRRHDPRTRAPTTSICCCRSSPTRAPTVDGHVRRVSGRARPIGREAIDFVTLPYPGLATDFQPILMAMLAVADGDEHRDRERLREPVPLRRRAPADGRRHPDRGPPRGDPRGPAALGGTRSARSTSGRVRRW